MAGGVGFVLGFIAVVFVHHATAQAVVHTVGDSTNWMVPPSTSFYTEWASNKTFRTGDSLLFRFQTGAHDVLELKTKGLFDACNFTNNDNDIERTGPVTKTLEDPGMHYFVCTFGRHCLQGQKLAINVVAATAGGPTSPSTPQTPSSTMPPPSPSSSNALTATLYLTLSGLLMAFF